MRIKLLFFCIITSFILPIPTVLPASEIIIIKSSDIIPFQKSIEGFKQGFPQGSFSEYSIDEDYKEKGRSVLDGAIKRGGDLILAVGPQATYLLGSTSSSIPRIFTMVKNPGKLFSTGKAFYGVSLDIPISLQLEQIKTTFPDRKRIGVFFSRENNQDAIDVLLPKARELSLVLIAIPITSAKEIPDKLKSLQADIDILLIIPDRVIGSEKILKYIIKNMLIKKIPVVGFNEWFAQNGAILAFSLDYEAIGKQTAELAQQVLEAQLPIGQFIQEPQQVRTIVNLKVAQKLEISVREDLLRQMGEVIK
jgi:putative ABC transport system substrate-binding protein